MKPHRSLLAAVAALMTLPLLAQIGRAVELPLRISAEASAPDLLQGCGDIPEVVQLVNELRIRENRVQKYLEAIDRREADIKTAETTLRERLTALQAAQTTRPRKANPEAVAEDITRLIAVYDQMAPKDAAAVISALPPAFASEILMRVSPETGARIMAAVAPEQAAILTTHMGARSVRKQ